MKEQTVSRYRLRLEREEVEHVEVEHRPAAVARFLWERIFEQLDREAMVTVFLGTDGRITGWNLAYVGGIDNAKVEPRGIVVPALLSNAAAIVIAHNHPSGDPNPSKEDTSFTLRMAEACKILGIHLKDSLIIAEGRRAGDPPKWISMRERLAW
jgi:DNA repair protein RadC